MTSLTLPSPQSPIAVTGGSLSPEWFRFFFALIAALNALDARAADIEARVTALEALP